MRKTRRTGLRVLLCAAAFSIAAIAHAASTSELVNVTAVIESVNACTIATRDAELDFGPLDSLNPVDVRTSAAMSFACSGNGGNVYFTAEEDGGRYGSGLSRMRHSSVSTAYIQYRLDLSPRRGAAAEGAEQTLRIWGELSGDDYRHMRAGDYEDRVLVTITP